MLLIQMQHLLHVTYFIFIFFVVFFYRTELWKETEADRNPPGFNQVEKKIS